jgi:16S rRNA pseudouridine516 synthase
MSDRIDAFLAHRGFGTRSSVRELIRRGAVRVGGHRVNDYGHQVAGQEVKVKGQVVPVGIFDATLLVHKPLGVSCSHDEREAPLLYDAIPAPWTHLPLESAGRLDRDTTGLLIVTTDGALIHRLTNPKKHLAKRYRLAYSGTLSSHAVERVASGIVLAGDPKPTLPAELTLDGTAPDGLGLATMTLSEGRYHQVRKMIEELGGTVVRLHRDRIGGLDLPADLDLGAMREVTPAELELLHGRTPGAGTDAGPAAGGLASTPAP